MLLSVNDTAVLLSIVIYAIIPIVRYTIFGLQSVPNHLIEAGLTSGCTRWQLFWKIKAPMVIPQLMLGLNQCLLFALLMVVLAAYIGTIDLGQEMQKALSDQDAGKGLTLGLCVAFMGLAVDQLIQAWATKKKKILGLA